MQKIATLHVDLAALRAGAHAGPLLGGTQIARTLAGEATGDQALHTLLAAHDTCTVVYHACGTCAEGGARVEYFCTDGGAEPDYVGCEPC